MARVWLERFAVSGVVLAASACRLGFDFDTSGIADGTDAAIAADAGAGLMTDPSAKFFGLPRCPAGVVFCADFEAAQIDPNLWATSGMTNGTVAVDSKNPAARGANSLHFAGNAVPTGTLVNIGLAHVETGGLPNPTFVRWFVYAPTVAANTAQPMAWMSAPSGQDGVQIGSNYLAQVKLDGWGVGLAAAASASPFPTGRWACIEWKVERGTPGVISVWVDDAPVTDLQTVPWGTPPAFGSVTMGLAYAATAGAISELWVDEVIIDGARVGCAK